MPFEINNAQDIKRLAKIYNELIIQDQKELAAEFVQFSNTFHTTSSEFLGEFQILLKKVIDQKNLTLKKDTKRCIIHTINKINMSFGNRV